MGDVPLATEEIEGYTFLSKDDTALPFGLLVDCGQSYKYFSHPLWLYVICNEGKLVPITIEEDPIVLGPEVDGLDVIKQYIRLNIEALSGRP